jgi:hypothetical protein
VAVTPAVAAMAMAEDDGCTECNIAVDDSGNIGGNGNSHNMAAVRAAVLVKTAVRAMAVSIADARAMVAATAAVRATAMATMAVAAATAAAVAAAAMVTADARGMATVVTLAMLATVGSYKLPLIQYMCTGQVVACSFQQKYDFSQIVL